MPGFLIVGTVFNENALSFPAVEIRIRRLDQKKFRWNAYTNSRGEFALRVPDDRDYEVLVHVKHYQDQKRTVMTHNGDAQQRLAFRLEPDATAKTGASK